jgi:hypothetical protein
MEQIKSERCPLNVIYIRVLKMDCSIYSMGAGKYLFIDAILGSYSVPAIDFTPLLSKHFAFGSAVSTIF